MEEKNEAYRQMIKKRCTRAAKEEYCIKRRIEVPRRKKEAMER